MTSKQKNRALLDVCIGSRRFCITQVQSSPSVPVPSPAPCKYYIDETEVCREAFCTLRDTMVTFLNLPDYESMKRAEPK